MEASNNGISELEKRRIENIERNAKYLAELGLASNGSTKRSLLVNKNSSKLSKRSNGPKKNEIEVISPFIELRRSSRVALQEPKSYKEPNIPHLPRFNRPDEGEVDGSLVDNLENGLYSGIETTAENMIIKNEQPAEDSAVVNGERNVSCALLNADIDYWLQTHFCNPVEDYGKAAVMKLSTVTKVEPKFNKYPGVIEWKNCIYLWVNVGGSTGYTNTFSEGGRYMMWYGGSKMHSETKVVLRLVEAGKRVVNEDKKIKSETDSISSNDEILLFVRIEGENYACIGRVKHIAVDLTTSPIRLKWELMDFERMSKVSYFQTLLAAGKCI